MKKEQLRQMNIMTFQTFRLVDISDSTHYKVQGHKEWDEGATPDWKSF